MPYVVYQRETLGNSPMTWNMSGASAVVSYRWDPPMSAAKDSIMAHIPEEGVYDRQAIRSIRWRGPSLLVSGLRVRVEVWGKEGMTAVKVTSRL